MSAGVRATAEKATTGAGETATAETVAAVASQDLIDYETVPVPATATSKNTET